jgi:phosphoglycerate dehydrogenase-like enzyme
MRLAILDDYEKAALALASWERLGPDIKIDVYEDHVDREDALVRRLLPYDILIIMRERTSFPRSLIEQLPNLKLLITSGAKNDAVDVNACRALGIVVSGTKSSKEPPAELTWGLVLSLMRKIPQLAARTRQGEWGSFPGRGLNGKVLGLLGLGTIGFKVAAVAKAFGMKMIAWSQNLSAENASMAGATRVEKDALFAEADIISIHLVLSQRTRGLVGARELSLMKSTAFIINTSRGPIIDERALINALQQGRIAGAGLDVFETEPLPPDHPFLKLSNTVVTPHIGYVTVENFQTYFSQAIEDVLSWQAGKPIREL